jgi:thiosulfate dehydrogenase [quinone] large subunit
LDRREFLRRFVILAVMGGAGASGVFALVQKVQEGLVKSPPILQAQTPTLDPSTNSTSSGSAASVQASSTSAQTTTNATSSPPQGYVFLAPLSALSGRTFAYFNHPTGGSSILVDYNGTWKAFSAVCTHAGCTVNFSSSELVCPCHNGYFSAVDGSVLSGPPPAPLAEYDVKVSSGNLYVSSARIN